jgi:hypothetical protein
MKIAFVDLDGVVADSTARMRRAEEARDAFLASPQRRLNVLLGTPVDIYWQTAFDPELIGLDQPVEGAQDVIDSLEVQGWRVIFLSSRPEAMRAATERWLASVGYPKSAWTNEKYEIILKADLFRFVKTTVWKVAMIQTIAAFYGVQQEEILLVDDEVEIREVALDAMPNILCFSSLNDLAFFA